MSCSIDVDELIEGLQNKLSVQKQSVEEIENKIHNLSINSIENNEPDVFITKAFGQISYNYSNFRNINTLNKFNCLIVILFHKLI